MPSPPWEITADTTGSDLRLRLGAREIPLAQVRAVQRDTTSELNVDGHMAAIGLFLGLGCCFVIPVVTLIAPPRFLLGALLFLGIGAMTISDLGSGHRSVVQRVRLQLASGETEIFTSVDAVECDELVAALDACRSQAPATLRRAA